jgi:hypothetical protein
MTSAGNAAATSDFQSGAARQMLCPVLDARRLGEVIEGVRRSTPFRETLAEKVMTIRNVVYDYKERVSAAMMLGNSSESRGCRLEASQRERCTRCRSTPAQLEPGITA